MTSLDDSTLLLQHINGEHHNRKYIRDFYVNYDFAMIACLVESEEKELLEEIVSYIHEKEGKRYVNLIRDGNLIEWSKDSKDSEAENDIERDNDDDDDDNDDDDDDNNDDDNDDENNDAFSKRPDNATTDVQRMVEGAVGLTEDAAKAAGEKPRSIYFNDELEFDSAGDFYLIRLENKMPIMKKDRIITDLCALFDSVLGEDANRTIYRD